MNFSELIYLLERSERFREMLNQKSGKGTFWSHVFDDGEKHFYTIEGIKPPEEIEDELSSIFLWLWSLKDYVKKYSMQNGASKSWVELKINDDPHLCICADLANSLKHGGLDPNFKSRSKKNPKLGKLKYKIPQDAIGSLTFGAFDVNLKVSNPSKVLLEMPVLGEKDNFLGDAFKYMEYGLDAWENIANEADHAAV